jgi:hypothetical protein
MLAMALPLVPLVTCRTLRLVTKLRPDVFMLRDQTNVAGPRAKASAQLENALPCAE